MKNKPDSRPSSKYSPNYLEIVAKTGRWDEIPLDNIPEEELCKKNSMGSSPLHMAAIYGTLKLVPKKLMTNKTLMCKTDAKQTVLHIAASNKQLQDIPKGFITAQTISTKDKEENTVLHLAAYGSQLEHIDSSLLNMENLLEKNFYGKTPLDLLLAFSLENSKSTKTLKTVLRKLNDKTLQEVYEGFKSASKTPTSIEIHKETIRRQIAKEAKEEQEDSLSKGYIQEI